MKREVILMSKMKPFEEKTVELKNGETIFYRHKKGGSNTLILLHGNMNASDNWDMLMNELSTDFTIYALDMRGFGESSYNNEIESIKDLSDDLNDFSNQLKLSSFDF